MIAMSPNYACGVAQDGAAWCWGKGSEGALGTGTVGEPGVARRTFVEAVHQAGHLVGLSYCEDARCAMFLATTITDAERRQLHLCNNCRNELAKIRRV